MFDQVQLRQEAIDKVREKYSGDLYEVAPHESPESLVLFRPATKLESLQYLKNRDNDQTRNEAGYMLACACVLSPDRVSLDVLFDRFPFFAPQLAGEIIIRSGGGEATSKKV